MDIKFSGDIPNYACEVAIGLSPIREASNTVCLQASFVVNTDVTKLYFTGINLPVRKRF